MDIDKKAIIWFLIGIIFSTIIFGGAWIMSIKENL